MRDRDQQINNSRLDDDSHNFQDAYFARGRLRVHLGLCLAASPELVANDPFSLGGSAMNNRCGLWRLITWRLTCGVNIDNDSGAPERRQDGPRSNTHIYWRPCVKAVRLHRLEV